MTAGLAQRTGTPGWDATTDPALGMDANDTNDVIRVNDYITYNVEIVATAIETNTTFTIVLPAGYELTAVPAYCLTGGTPASSLSAPSPPPGPNLTATSYQALVPQTLVCNVGDRTGGTVFSYPVTAKVRSELPPGSTHHATVAIQSDQTPLTAPVDGPSSTVASAPRWSMSTTGVELAPSSGFASPYQANCPFNTAISCINMRYQWTIFAENGGKGAMPLRDGGLRFTLDLSPETVYNLPSTTPGIDDPAVQPRLDALLPVLLR